MALTETQRLLIACLKHLDVSKGTAMGVCLLLKEEAQQMDMVEYLLSKKMGTDEEVLEQARKISGE